MRASVLTREFPPDVYGGAGVHVDFLVRELSKLIDVDPDAYLLETTRWTSSQYGPAREGDDLPYDAAGEFRAGQFHFVWPNWTLNVLPGPPHVRVLVFQPLGPDRTASFVSPGSKR